MSDEGERPTVGARAFVTWSDGSVHGVTVVPTGRRVSPNEVNVMYDGTGSVQTVRVGRLAYTEAPQGG